MSESEHHGHHRRGGVEYEDVGSEYMQKRQLQKGAAGWVLLAGLGVAYVISGDFAGWNFGLAEGGWGGLLIATLLMATMYTAMVFSLAELSSTIPTAGGGYGFARRAMGPLGGFATGTAILINIAVFGATISYVLMMLSHIVLRRREPDLERPYRTPGGMVTSGVALVLGALAVIATFIVDERAALITLGVYVLFIAYFAIYSRHHLVAQAPEEEFAAIEKAEAELAGS